MHFPIINSSGVILMRMVLAIILILMMTTMGLMIIVMPTLGELIIVLNGFFILRVLATMQLFQGIITVFLQIMEHWITPVHPLSLAPTFIIIMKQFDLELDSARTC